MGSSPFTMRSILAFFLLVVQIASALKFDLPATSGHGKNERCIRNFIAKDQLVVVTAIVSGSKGDGQRVNMHVRDIPIWAPSCPIPHSTTLRYGQQHRSHESASVFDHRC